jgi:Carboxypeptidase regulatory-like domain
MQAGRKDGTMKSLGYRYLFLPFLLLFLMGTVVASAATLQGTVLDPKGANVPGAQVRLLDSHGAELAHTLTDGRGHFRIEGLAVGPYTIEVSLPGFETTSSKASPGQKVRVVLPLAPIH